MPIFFFFWVSYEIEVELDSIWTPEEKSSVPTSFINLIKARIFSAHPVYLGGIDEKWVGKEIPPHWNFEDCVLWAANVRESRWWISHTWPLSAQAEWAYYQKLKRNVGGGSCQGIWRPDLPSMWSSTSTDNSKTEEEVAEDQAMWAQQVMTLRLFFVCWAHLPCLRELLRQME